jgi:hypothetical protein
MNKTYILFVSFLFIFCKESNYNDAVKTIAEKPGRVVIVKINCYEDSTWIQHFREFRNAVYQHDKNKTKSFFVFPIMNDNNEIWDLVTDGNTEALKLRPGKTKLFTEKDFDLYFDKLFPKRFVSSILKIKTDELYKKGETETIELQEGKATTYQMILHLIRLIVH